ncbi:MAG: lamin tail domain-containing protein [Candidatus Paceibacterota bacterium]
MTIPSRVSAIEFNLFGFSEKTPQTFSEFEAKNILKKFNDKLFDSWGGLEADAYSDPRVRTTLSFLKQVLGYDVWNYIFQDLPTEVSIKVAKAVAEIARIIVSDDVMSLVIEKLEKETVRLSVEYAMEQLFKSDVKIAFGATRVSYDTGKVKVDSALQYIMVYTPIDKEKGNIVVRIYSPYEIDPPISHGSVGMIIGFVNNLPEGEKIPPFVVEFKGVIGKKYFPWDYCWYGDPSIAVYFPDNVPDFGFRPISNWDKYIVNPVKEAIESVTGFFGKLFSKGEVTEYLPYEEQREEVKQEVEEMSNNVNDYVENKEVKQEETKEEALIIKETSVPKIDPLETQEEKKECVLSSSNPKRSSVLINEVAWMGSKNSANDEWVELKNISSAGVNIKGWSFYDKDKQINVFFEEDYIVPAYGLVLLERTDDTSVPYVKADFIYSGAISNKDEALYLFDSSCELQDFTEANSQWPAGQSEERRTMERGEDLTWHSYSGSGYADMFGTPKQENGPKKIEDEKSIETEPPEEESSNSNSNGNNNNNSGGIGGATINYCSQSNLSNPILSPIIINEVAWMGTQFGSSDEWIELKNISGADVNLNNWQLLDKDNQIKVVFDASDIVPANGFYLLERTDDTSVPNMLFNRIYSGALSDANESLRLFNSGCELVDEAKAEENWPAGDKDNKKTMERNGDLNGWHAYSLSAPDEISGLFGTPKRENSELVEGDQQQEGEEENNDGQQQITSGLIMSEVELGDENGYEYVEIFNQSEEVIDLCPDENNCYRLSYFSNQEQEHNWDDPNHSWLLEGLMINPNSYLLLGDKEVASNEIDSFQLSNSTGSLALFSNNPIYGGEEEKTQEEKIAYAQSLKVDAVAWKGKTGDPEPAVKEGQAFVLTGEGVLGRKYIEGKYIDSDNNFNDFEMQKKSPEDSPSYPPEAINDLSVQGVGSRRNSVILSWTPPPDQDTNKDALDYEVFYSLNQEINVNNLIQIDGYIDVEIEKKEESVSVLISDLYYDSNYFFAVKAKDPEGNYSPISNIVNYSVSSAQHVKASLYIDYGRRNKSSFIGPTDESVVETAILIQGEDDKNWNDGLSSPLIDENGDIYFSGILDDNKGVYVFNDSVKKWFYECPSGCNKLFLNSDGTLYAFDGPVLIALSPSGKLKWREDLSQSYAFELAIDSNKIIYLLGSFQGTPSLFVLEDNQDAVGIATFNLGADYDYFSNLVLDGENNIYFFADTTLFKFNRGGKTGERSMEVIYDEGYEGDKDKLGRVNDLALSSQGTLLFNVFDGGYDKDGKAYNVFYALNKDNILSEPLWTKKDFSTGPIGVSGEEFFMQAGVSGLSGWHHLYLYSVNVLTGEINWTKHWQTSGSSVSAITSDADSNIYFTQLGGVWSYNLSNVSDEDPEHDRIFSALGANSNISEPIALGQGVMYVLGGKTISKIVFNP